MKIYKKIMNALAAVEKIVLDPGADCGKRIFP